MIIKNPPSKKTIFLVIFAIIFILSFRFFIHSFDNIGHNWDWGFPSLKIFYTNFSLPSKYTWNRMNLGYVNDLTISHLFVNAFIALLGTIFGSKFLLFFIFLSVSTISFYGFKFLLDHVVKSSYINHIPALLYAFSPFLLNDIIGGSWVMWLSYAFAPIYFVLILKYLKNKQTKYLLLSLLTSSLIITSLQHFVLINFLLVLYLLYDSFILKTNLLKNSLKQLAVFVSLTILTNTHWLLPFSYSLLEFAKNTISASTSLTEFDPVTFSTQNIWTIFNLSGYLDRNMYTFSLPPLLIILFQASAAISWFIIFLFLTLEKQKRVLKKSLFWLLSLLFLIILIKGGNLPFPYLTVKLYQNLFFLKMFRSPQHLMFISAFIIPILISFSLHHFYKTAKDKVLVLFVFFTLIFIWISGFWFSGDLGHHLLSQKDKDHLDFFSLSPKLKEYYSIAHNNQLDYRSFFLPAVYSPRYLKTKYQDNAQGLQPEYMYLSKPTFTSEANRFADRVEFSFCKDLKFNYINYLSLFSVKDIVLRSDIFPYFTASSWCWDLGKINKKLSTNSTIEPFTGNEELVAYRINQESFLPHFYTPQQILTSTGSAEFLPSIVSQPDYQIRSAIYLEKDNNRKASSIIPFNTAYRLPLLEFKPINPTKYRLLVHQATSAFPLIFSENYHRGWKLYLSNSLSSSSPGKSLNLSIDPYQDSSLFGTTQNNNLSNGNFSETWFKQPVFDNKNHFIVNGYANAWFVNPSQLCRQGIVSNCTTNKDGSHDFELVVEFWPQRLLYFGLTVSLLAYLCLLAYYIYVADQKK